ncbi:MAG: XTP/dITP diphosphatase [Candidatus Omnitrophica bacterium]|nr:XTP/dITP diphosphatase [Candidatus Omnitrophota bacterium]
MIKEIVIATRNKDKKKEIEKLLSGLSVKVLSLYDFPSIPPIKENGATFEENALTKASVCAVKTGKLSISDDSGLMVHSLNGAPGVYSARFAGKNVTYDDNNRKLLMLLKSKPRSRRRARFVCCIAIVTPEGKKRIVKGTSSGIIAECVRGKHGFGYDPLFIPDGFSKTFAELGEKIKNKVSHRGRALRKAKKIISGYFEESYL